MKLKVTEKGVFGADGKEIEVGKVLTVDGDEVPAWLINKAVSLDDDNALDHDGDGKSGGATNAEREELKAQAKELGIEHPKNISTEKLKELVDAKLAA